MANLIVAEIMVVAGDHLSSGPSFVLFDRPFPNAYAKSPPAVSWVLGKDNSIVESGIKKLKKSTVSIPRLEWHWSETTARILSKYEFGLDIPDTVFEPVSLFDRCK